MSIEAGMRRPMTTIVELSPEQALTSADELNFTRDDNRTSLSPLAQGTLSNVLSTFVAISRKTGTTTVNINQKDRKKSSPTRPQNLIPETIK